MLNQKSASARPGDAVGLCFVKRPLRAVCPGTERYGGFTLWMNYMACDVPTSRVKIGAAKGAQAPNLIHGDSEGRPHAGQPAAGPGGLAL